VRAARGAHGERGLFERCRNNAKLVPGMPVEVFIKTYDRTVISYFTKPLHDQILRAFRER
jgi:hypothetical protein